MKKEQIASSYPVLFHMASGGAWPLIRKHGLLSTIELLKKFKIDADTTETLVSQYRPHSVEVVSPEGEIALVRDQRPMSDSGLVRALPESISPSDWYEKLNSLTFFWPTEERLKKMYAAKPYIGKKHDIIKVDSNSFVEEYYEHIVLCPINSGCTKPFAHKRDFSVFHEAIDYPFEQRRKSRGLSNAVAEIAVPGGVPNISDYVIEVLQTENVDGEIKILSSY